MLILAILFGAWYFIEKEFYPPEVSVAPRAVVTHEIFSACLDDEHRWIRAMVEVRNTGRDPVELSESHHYYVQLVPVDDELGAALLHDGSTGSDPVAMDWGRFVEPREILEQSAGGTMTASARVVVESNETHRQYLDFVIAPSARVIEITSTFKDTAGNENKNASTIWVGEAKTLYEIKADPACAE